MMHEDKTTLQCAECCTYRSPNQQTKNLLLRSNHLHKSFTCTCSKQASTQCFVFSHLALFCRRTFSRSSRAVYIKDRLSALSWHGSQDNRRPSGDYEECTEDAED